MAIEETFLVVVLSPDVYQLIALANSSLDWTYATHANRQVPEESYERCKKSPKITAILTLYALTGRICPVLPKFQF